MSRVVTAGSTLAALCLLVCAPLPAAATVRASSASVAASAATSCTSTSSTGFAPSRYNRTPSGRGPWHVPKDPCNTEAQGSRHTPYGNCAYWAAEKRPDVWKHAVWLYGYPGIGGAWDIERDARRAGYRITHRPHRGDVAAWRPNAVMGGLSGGVTESASPGGHVGYVEKVHGRRIVLSEMGVSASGGYTRTLRYHRHASYFIHRQRSQ